MVGVRNLSNGLRSRAQPPQARGGRRARERDNNNYQFSTVGFLAGVQSVRSPQLPGFTLDWARQGEGGAPRHGVKLATPTTMYVNS